MDGIKKNSGKNIQVVKYKMIQECINNTIKHAEASKVEISVVQTDKILEATFRDNGKGFNPLKISSKNDGLGLDNIKSRIDVLKGNLKIESAEGKGTAIIMKIPV